MSSKSYPNITEALSACVKKTSSAQHGTVYDPPTGDTGTATTKGTWGHIVLSYALDPAT